MEEFDILDLDLGSRVAPPAWAVEFTPRPESEASKPARRKVNRQRPKRDGHRQRADARARLEEGEGEGELHLPAYLLRYGQRLRSHNEYSGPALLEAESEQGCVEYKLMLSTSNHLRFQQLVTQLKFRLIEGGGQCQYFVGVEDNGHPRGLEPTELTSSLAALASMASEVGAVTVVERTPPGLEGRRCAVVCVRACPTAGGLTHQDLRIAVAGSVDSGKSTLVAVLAHGAEGRPALDNGRGSARMNVLRHKHELLSGRTSSISHQLVGYDSSGRVLNYGKAAGGVPRTLMQTAARVARFSDLGGHEKYSKTSLYGLTCTLPDYAMLCVCAAGGLSCTTLEHLAAALALGVPPFVVLTKVDVAPPSRVAALVAEVSDLVAAARLKAARFADVLASAAGAPLAAGLGGAVAQRSGLAPLVYSEAQAVELAAVLGRQRAGLVPPSQVLVPIFAASSVTGASVPLLHAFFNALPPADEPAPEDEAAALPEAEIDPPAHFQIDTSFEVAGVGLVVGGTVVQGCITTASRMLLGPTHDGAFAAVRVVGIQRSLLEVDQVGAGQHATLAIEPQHAQQQLEDAAVDAAAVSDAGDATERAPSTSNDSSSTGSSPVVHRPRTPPPAASTAVHICPPSKHKSPATDADLALLGASWEFTRQVSLPGSPALPPPCHSASPRWRKGSVLLDPGFDPRSVECFEAVVVLLGGSWPVRGLLSGKFPPEGDSDSPGTPGTARGSWPWLQDGALDGSDSGSLGSRSPSELRLLDGGRRRGPRLGGQCGMVVHCAGIRQAARVVWMQELQLADDICRRQLLEECEGGATSVDAIVAGLAAAGVLMHWGAASAPPPGPQGASFGGGALQRQLSGGAVPQEEVGCVARVRFKFVHRPEWMLPGSRLILRDHGSGKVAGAGVVAAVGDDQPPATDGP